MKKRILIIDDDPFVGQALKKVLHEAGYLAAVCEDGEEGVTKLESGHFDLLVLDLNLPGLSGFDILDRTRVRHSALRVVVLTAFADQCEPGSMEGADAVFEKPPDVRALLTRIDKLLSEPATKWVRRPFVRPRIRRLNPGKPLSIPGLFPTKAPD